MIYGSVCSGIEAATQAWESLGWTPAWFAEIDDFPSKLLKHYYPLVPNLGDMTLIATMIRAGTVTAPDVLVGGTPCQAFSIAGLRDSLNDVRGQLTLAFVKLADAIDESRSLRGKPPAIIVWENVPGVLNTPDNAFGCFLGALAGEDRPLEPPGGRWSNAGCVFGPVRSVAWRITDAQYFGVAQRRARVFVVASARDGFDPTEILFERDGVRRDSAPSRKAREEVTGTIGARTTGGGGFGTDFELGGGCNQLAGTLRSTDGGADLDRALVGHLQPVEVICMAHGQGGAEIASERRTTLTCNHEAPIIAGPITRSVERPRGDGLDTLIAGTLQANGKAAGSATQQDAESGMLLPVMQPICFSVKDHGGDAMVDLSPTMRAGNSDKSHPNAGNPPGIAYRVHAVNANGMTNFADEVDTARCLDSNGGYATNQGGNVVLQQQCVTGDISHALTEEGHDASEDGTGRGTPITTYAIQIRATAANLNSGPAGLGVREEIGYTLEAQMTSQAVAFRASGQESFTPSYITPPLTTSDGGGSGVPTMQSGMAVRRLTPKECERLQSFPDNWTLIPIRKLSAKRVQWMREANRMHELREIDGEWWLLAADGPRYKALGNSFCVNNIKWIGVRIKEWLEKQG